MARINLIDIMKQKEKSPMEFHFDSLNIPPLLCYIPIEGINELYSIVTSLRYTSKIVEKINIINNIMKRYGFRKMFSGTNRVVYAPYEDQRFMVKVAIDKIGIKNNCQEMVNQVFLKPFVTKCFDISYNGVIASYERVRPITSRLEFQSVAEDVFELLYTKILGKYVMEDVGEKYFMNFGVRDGFGVVLLDFSDLYELDGNKLYCNDFNPELNMFCGGEIDYDDGINHLICTKCGKRYFATDLQAKDQNKIVIKRGVKNKMKITFTKNNGEEYVRGSEGTKTIERPKGNQRRKPRPEYVKPGVKRLITKFEPASEMMQNTVITEETKKKIEQKNVVTVIDETAINHEMTDLSILKKYTNDPKEEVKPIVNMVPDDEDYDEDSNVDEEELDDDERGRLSEELFNSKEVTDASKYLY